MAAITRSANFEPSIASLLPDASQKHSGLYAGMALKSFDACYIDATTNKVFASLDTGASTAQSNVHGFAARKCSSGDPITLIFDIEVGYADASGLTPGASVYLSSSVAGGLDTSASNSHAPVGHATSDQVLFVRKRLV